MKKPRRELTGREFDEAIGYLWEVVRNSQLLIGVFHHLNCQVAEVISDDEHYLVTQANRVICDLRLAHSRWNRQLWLLHRSNRKIPPSLLTSRIAESLIDFVDLADCYGDYGSYTLDGIIWGIRFGLLDTALSAWEFQKIIGAVVDFDFHERRKRLERELFK